MCSTPNCNCGCTPCQGIYGTNMWNVNSTTSTSCCGTPSPCNGCVDVLKGICVLFTGSNLINLGINTNDDMNTVLSKLDAVKKVLDDKITAIEGRLDALEAA